MSMRTNIINGNWRLLPNHAEDEKGTIHDNFKAIKRGFRRGIVGGPTVAQAIFPTLRKIFGGKWLENGWLSVKFISPVYDDEEIQEIAEITNKNSIKFQILTKGNRLALIGNAGIGNSPPWDINKDLQKGADKAFPDIKIAVLVFLRPINFFINFNFIFASNYVSNNIWFKFFCKKFFYFTKIFLINYNTKTNTTIKSF